MTALVALGIIVLMMGHLWLVPANRTNLHLTLLLIGPLAVVFSLPYKQGLRYFYNVLPLIIMYCLYGLQPWEACGKAP